MFRISCPVSNTNNIRQLKCSYQSTSLQLILLSSVVLAQNSLLLHFVSKLMSHSLMHIVSRPRPRLLRLFHTWSRKYQIVNNPVDSLLKCKMQKSSSKNNWSIAWILKLILLLKTSPLGLASITTTNRKIKKQFLNSKQI